MGKRAGTRKRARGARPSAGRATRRQAVPQAQSPLFPVIGVGASAGGLEAFSKLLTKIPGDTHVAIVLVQHLSPSHESHLPELLSTSTRFPVQQARDGMKVEPGHVYVTPPDATMAVVDGTLRIGQRPTDRT